MMEIKGGDASVVRRLVMVLLVVGDGWGGVDLDKANST